MRSLSVAELNAMTREQLVEEVKSVRSELRDALQLLEAIDKHIDDGMLINMFEFDAEEALKTFFEGNKRVMKHEEKAYPRPKV